MGSGGGQIAGARVKAKKVNLTSVLISIHVLLASPAFLGPAAARPTEPRDGIPRGIRHFEPVVDFELQPHPRRSRALRAGFAAFRRHFELELEPNRLIAPDAKVIWIGDETLVEEPPSLPLYKGRLAGEPQSWVRFSLRDGDLEGLIWTPEEIYFVQPRRQLEAGATSGSIIYRLSDTDPSEDPVTCGVEGLEGDLDPDGGGFGALESMAGGGGSATYQQADMGIVADYEYYLRHGASSATDMLSILNQVDGVYEAETGVSLNVTQTVVHTTSSDPFTSTTSPQTLLTELSNYKSSAGSPIYGTDLAHLFTGRDLDGTTVGIAWLGTVCSNYYGTALSQDFSTVNKALVLLAAHEIGHNFAAPHDNQADSPCGAEPFGYIMNPWVSTSLNLLFSACSKTHISGEVGTVSCLSTVSAATPTPTATPTRTLSPTHTGTPTRTQTSPPTQTNSPSPTHTAAPTATATPSVTPVGFEVRGAVRYYRDQRAVSATTVRCLGTTTESTLTASSGSYGFSNLPSESLVFEPEKTGDLGGAISSFDAAQILQAVVGKTSFDPFQQLACDVTGNGSISSLDATRILQLVVGKITRLPVADACASDWAFLPNPSPMQQTITQPAMESGSCQRGSITVDSLTASLDGQDFHAVLFGDCTGNWQPPAAAGDGGTAVSMTAPGRVRLQRMRRVRSGLIRVPVAIRSGDDFQSLELKLRYDRTRFRLARVRRLARAANALLAYNETAAGVKIALASGTPMRAGGRVVVVELEPLRNEAPKPEIEFVEGRVDEVPAILDN